MIRFAKMIFSRLVLGVFLLLVISVLVFVGIQLLPGDLARAVLGQSATQEAVDALRQRLGLNLPLHTQYINWMLKLVQGNLGTSLANGYPISELLGSRMANTFFLAGVAALISIPSAIALGVVSALYRGRALDRTISSASLSLISLPEFFVAYVLILLLAIKASVFPSTSLVEPGMSLADRLYVTLLPALTLALIVTAHMMRMIRASIIGVLSSSYIEMAVLKGLSPRRIILHYALPNAMSPVINVIVLNLAYLIVGVVVVEVVFNYPGMGKLLADAVSKRDIPVIQVGVMVFASTYIILNIAADILSIVTNPKLMHPR